MGFEELISKLNSGNKDIIDEITAIKPGVKRPYKSKGPKSGTEEDLKSRLKGKAGAIERPAYTSNAARPVLSARIAARSATPTPALGGAQLQTGAAQNVPVPGRAPLASRIKAVLDVLSANREFHSLETLTSRVGISIFEDEELRHELSQHPNIEIVTESYRYKPKTPGIFNRQDLLRHLRQLTTAEAVTDKGLAGVKVGAVDDAYIGVMDDIKILQRDGHIYKFDHTHNAAEAVLFYNERDPRMGLNIQPSEQLISLFHTTSIPEYARDLEEAVAKSGQKSYMAHRPKLPKMADDPKDKKRKRREARINVQKATNAHLPELFSGAGPQEIDRRD